MHVLLLCILCNVVLAVIFKNFSKYQVDNLQAIVVNYIVCVLFASALIGQSAVPLDLFSRPWWLMSLMLAVLFITGFNIMAISFQKSGVALTAIIQKMSLVMPASLAIAFYGEALTLTKSLGILLALLAIVLVNRPPASEDGQPFDKSLLMWPLVTFAMSGIIEIILFISEAHGLVGDDGMLFTASSFAQAAILGSIYALFLIIKGADLPRTKEVIGGIALGLPNYLSIYLLVYLLSQGWDGSLLFPLNSIGILVLTALIGFFLYKEKIHKANISGIILGIGAIILLSLNL